LVNFAEILLLTRTAVPKSVRVKLWIIFDVEQDDLKYICAPFTCVIMSSKLWIQHLPEGHLKIQAVPRSNHTSLLQTQSVYDV
jgi:hypothetical protein